MRWMSSLKAKSSITMHSFCNNISFFDFSVFCTSGNFQLDEWQMAGKVWQNEKMFVAVTATLALDFPTHLVPVWFSDVSVSLRCVLLHAPQEQKQTERQRYEEKFIFWSKHTNFQPGVCRKTSLYHTRGGLLPYMGYIGMCRGIG